MRSTASASISSRNAAGLALLIRLLPLRSAGALTARSCGPGEDETFSVQSMLDAQDQQAGAGKADTHCRNGAFLLGAAPAPSAARSHARGIALVQGDAPAFYPDKLDRPLVSEHSPAVDADQAVRTQRCHAAPEMTRRAHFADVLLALFAVSLLVFQPICEADEARHYDDPAGSCHSIGLAAPAQSPAATVSQGAGFPIAGGVAGSPAVQARTLEAGAGLHALPLPVPRYHARSARIQR